MKELTDQQEEDIKRTFNLVKASCVDIQMEIDYALDILNGTDKAPEEDDYIPL